MRRSVTDNADLGFPQEMAALGSDAVTQKIAILPDSHDIADIEYWICKRVRPTGTLQAMDVSKTKNCDKIVGIVKDGKLTPESVIAQGIAPQTVGFVEAADGKTFAKEQTGWMTLIPTICNADTPRIRPDLIGKAGPNF